MLWRTNLQINIFIKNNGSNEKLKATIDSLIFQKKAKNYSVKIFIISNSLNYFEEEKDFEFLKKKNIDSFVFNVDEELDFYSRTILTLPENGISYFCESGDLFSKKFFVEIMKVSEKDWDICIFDCMKDPDSLEAIQRVNLNYDVNPNQIRISKTLFRNKAIVKYGIDKNYKEFALYNMLYRLLIDNEFILRLPRDVVAIKGIEGFTENKNDEKWYIYAFEKFYPELLEYCVKSKNNIPIFFQYIIYCELTKRFKENINTKNKHVIDDKVEKFFKICSKILSYISLDVMYNIYDVNKMYNPKPLRFVLTRFKYGQIPKITKEKDVEQKDINFLINEVVVDRLSVNKVFIDVLDITNDEVILECAGDFYYFDIENLKVHFNGKPYKFEETTRFAHTSYFGKTMIHQYTFRVVLPTTEFINKKNNIQFIFKYNTEEIPLEITSNKYTSKISSVPNSYCICNGFLIYKGEKDKSLIIKKAGKLSRFPKELKFLSQCAFAREHSRRMFIMRMLYWFTKPFFINKNIWITFDKLYKGGDCGEYLFKYIRNQKHKDVEIQYIMNRSSEDYYRLKKEGYKPIAFSSIKNKLYFMNSKVIMTTHVGVCGFNSFSKGNIKFVGDLLKFDVACIQHGLSVQDLPNDYNRLVNNFRRYYCASQNEIENLSRSIMGYEDKSLLKLTGIPRYDGLVSDDQKQILITPTWRNYIAMPPVMGSARPYNPNFVNTDYYKIYNKLINDPRLIETAKKNGYKIVYLLHPVTSSQIEDYEENESVVLLSAVGVNYEEILTQSSLMLTDYSGVQFDFAYMRKPVLYYHHPKLPPHYEEGGFFYKEQGFGEVYTEHECVVATLCNYMENGCKVDDYYIERINKFFGYNDLNSCKRIYEDMIEYLKEKDVI